MYSCTVWCKVTGFHSFTSIFEVPGPILWLTVISDVLYRTYRRSDNTYYLSVHFDLRPMSVSNYRISDGSLRMLDSFPYSSETASSWTFQQVFVTRWHLRCHLSSFTASRCCSVLKDAKKKIEQKQRHNSLHHSPLLTDDRIAKPSRQNNRGKRKTAFITYRVSCPPVAL